MRVLHFFKTYLPDSFTGVERVIWEIAEGLTSHGVQSDVLSLSAAPAAGPYRTGSHNSHQAKQDCYLASTGLSLSIFARFRELAAQADLVHYHFPWPMMDLVHLLERPACPTLVTYHSDKRTCSCFPTSGRGNPRAERFDTALLWVGLSP